MASTFGVLGIVARKYAHKIPFIVKINHNELLTYPNKFDQILFGTVEQAYDMGAAAVGATIYFGSDESDAADRRSRRGLCRTPTSWAWPPSSGATCATTPSRADKDYHVSADLTGQANHLGVTHPGRHHQAEAPREQRRLQGAERRLSYGKLDERVYRS